MCALFLHPVSTLAYNVINIIAKHFFTDGDGSPIEDSTSKNDSDSNEAGEDTVVRCKKHRVSQCHYSFKMAQDES